MNFRIIFIYIDFSKAFDTVPHLRSIEKTRTHYIGGKFFNWIENYKINKST